MRVVKSLQGPQDDRLVDGAPRLFAQVARQLLDTALTVATLEHQRGGLIEGVGAANGLEERLLSAAAPILAAIDLVCGEHVGLDGSMLLEHFYPDRLDTDLLSGLTDIETEEGLVARYKDTLDEVWAASFAPKAN